eukprot:COSAG01_NODE_3413_length_6125_cov_26.475938_3_plen_543_part_00
MSHSATATPLTPPGPEEPQREPQPEAADPSLGDGDGQTTEEGVPPESRAEIVTAVLASMWMARLSESDPGPPPADGVLKCAPLRRLGVRAMLTEFYAKHDSSKTAAQIQKLAAKHAHGGKFETLCGKMKQKYGESPKEVWKAVQREAAGGIAQTAAAARGVVPIVGMGRLGVSGCEKQAHVAMLTEFYAKHDSSKTAAQIQKLAAKHAHGGKFETLCGKMKQKYGESPKEVWKAVVAGRAARLGGGDGAREAVEARPAAARTLDDWRMAASFAELLIEQLGQTKEAQRLILEALREGAGLQAVLDSDGLPSGAFTELPGDGYVLRGESEGEAVALELQYWLPLCASMCPEDSIALYTRVAEAHERRLAAAAHKDYGGNQALPLELSARASLDMPTRTPRDEVFRRMDYNGNGALSLAEIDKAVVELWPEFNHKPALMRAYKAADRNGDGFIKRREFRLLLQYVMYFNELWHKFEEIDADDDRRLSLGEFMAGCEVVGHTGLSREEASREFEEMGSNHGGFVLYGEFCAWCGVRCVLFGGRCG